MKTNLLLTALFALMIFIGFSPVACRQGGEKAPLVPERVAVTTEPVKRTYIIGDEFDPAGMIVTVYYNDTSTEQVTDYVISGFDSDTAGEKNIIVEYQNKSALPFKVIVFPLGQPGSGVTLKKETLILTIGAEERLEYTVASDAPVKSVLWTTSNASIAIVDQHGNVTAKGFSSGGSDRYNTGGESLNPISAPATGAAVITVKTTDDAYSDTITITATTAGQDDIMSLPPLKDQFKDYFLIGNIFKGSYEITGEGANVKLNGQLTRHYNALTAENHMKPSYLIIGRDSLTGAFTWNPNNKATTDNFINAAKNDGIKIIGHTLLWHSQNPNWVWEQIAGKTGTLASGMNKEKAVLIMKQYIAEVVSHYAGKIYSWDVLNEIFPDNASYTADWKNAMRKNASGEGQDANPWYIAIGSDFVYEGFLAARKADPSAILYYNDYNTDMPARARLIRDMVRDVNDRYLSGNDKPANEDRARLLIEGIGMQEHHNLGITAQKIKTTIDLFRTLNVAGRNKIILSVSELDIIAYGQYSDLTSAGGQGANQNHNSRSTNQQLLTQANLYRDYMKLYMENSDIIERVSLWGVQDNNSWRSRGLPLLFDHNGKAKPSYYSFAGVLK